MVHTGQELTERGMTLLGYVGRQCSHIDAVPGLATTQCGQCQCLRRGLVQGGQLGGQRRQIVHLIGLARGGRGGCITGFLHHHGLNGNGLVGRHRGHEMSMLMMIITMVHIVNCQWAAPVPAAVLG